MTQKELQALIEQVSLAFFHRPFVHRAIINKRLRTTGGRYRMDNHNIEINAHFLKRPEDLLGIIKHELCHYHLHLTGGGYQHRDRDFKRLLAQVGGSRYAPDIGLRQKKGIHYLYRCTNCGKVYPRVRRLNVRKYVCGQCRGKLRLVEHK